MENKNHNWTWRDLVKEDLYKIPLILACVLSTVWFFGWFSEVLWSSQIILLLIIIILLLFSRKLWIKLSRK